MPTSFAEKISTFAGKCIQLQKKIVIADDTPENLLDLRQEIVDLEIWVRRRIVKNSLLPTILLVYFGASIGFFTLTKIDWSGFARGTLGVAAPEKLVSMGIAGALVYLATLVLDWAKVNSLPTGQIAGVISISTRTALAVIVPIVLVSLFFSEDGKVRKLEVTPELLSFACGYSAKLVIDLCSKVVEKVSTTIRAL